MTRNIVLTFFFFINTFISFSQYTWTNGEVILKNGKTITGEVKIPVVSKDLVHFNGKSKVRVKNNINGDKSVFNEDQVELIKFIYSEKEIAYFKYIPVSTKKKEIFCIVTTGAVTLYGRSVGMTSTRPGTITFHNLNEFYAQRANEDIATPLLTARPSKSFKNRATEYLSDCPTLVSKLKNKILKKENIIAVVEEYNSCTK
ncbi:hypothetical protein QSV08_07015 [Maribacter sp. BPC-D8]|uniref:hypothetical protein n=1 Tax=Maribacter sp. BPC-D8 TaxID=3053613 RepID=UPI002B47FEBD|nr:hypothetical protein [Maribacter sp. BPC-D8]WRI30994.1 hypothetical protein QSV08_07015 [Maribacter sp. BPC-D8]